MFLIGFFSKRKKFHIVEQRDTMDEVEAFLNNHDYGHFNKLVVFGQVSRPTKYAPDVAPVTSAEPDSGLESVSAVESDTQPRG